MRNYMAKLTVFFVVGMITGCASVPDTITSSSGKKETVLKKGSAIALSKGTDFTTQKGKELYFFQNGKLGGMISVDPVCYMSSKTGFGKFSSLNYTIKSIQSDSSSKSKFFTSFVAEAKGGANKLRCWHHQNSNKYFTKELLKTTLGKAFTVK